MKITITEKPQRINQLLSATQKALLEYSKEDAGIINPTVFFLVKNMGTTSFEMSLGSVVGEDFGDGFPVLPKETMQFNRRRIEDIWFVCGAGETVEARIINV